jgi:hypothetical protein
MSSEVPPPRSSLKRGRVRWFTDMTSNKKTLFVWRGFFFYAAAIAISATSLTLFCKKL